MSKPNNRRSFTALELQQRLLSNPALAAANPGFSIEPRGAEIERQRPASTPLSPSEGKDSGITKRGGKKRREMNQTEREFSMMLERDVRAGIIKSWTYEGLMFRWGAEDAFQYSPDFVIFDLIEDGKVVMRLIETKGSFIRPKDLQRFKAARNEFTMFKFELWSKTSEGWKLLY